LFKCTGTSSIKLKDGPQSQNVQIGRNVTFQCTWDKSSPDCYWIKDGSSVIITENQRYIIEPDTNCSLEIIGVQPADEGNWQCVFSKKEAKSKSEIGLAKLVVDDADFHQNITLTTQPSSATVTNGQDVTLQCNFNKAAPICFWGKDGDIIAIQGRYKFTGDKTKGNCSITIQKVNLLDNGLWYCGYPRTETESILRSSIANLSVYVTPSEPVIVVNGLPTMNGQKIFVSSLTDPPKISCWSENGNPATNLEWKLYGTARQTVSQCTGKFRVYNSIKNWLKISELSFNQNFQKNWQQSNLTCIASHPSYIKDHSTSVHLILGYEEIPTGLYDFNLYYGGKRYQEPYL